MGICLWINFMNVDNWSFCDMFAFYCLNIQNLSKTLPAIQWMTKWLSISYSCCFLTAKKWAKHTQQALSGGLCAQMHTFHRNRRLRQPCTDCRLLIENGWSVQQNFLNSISIASKPLVVIDTKRPFLDASNNRFFKNFCI